MNRHQPTEQPKGLLIVHTGNGKGKTSAALNLVYRHLAHGKRAAVVQFVKQPKEYDYGDSMMLKRLATLGAPVAVTMLGTGFTWNRTDRAKSREVAGQAWEVAAAAIGDPQIDLVVCDELHIALSYGQLDIEPVMRSILGRPASSHVATTGRGAPEPLIEAADLVTEFVEVKHPYKTGVRAQVGIEY
ncbi:cob(I)yrinic acid a,c-diamide adenosyltransferase [Myxococcota bacterium]